MSVCPNTGLAVPECSCPPCLRAQMREHMPKLIDSEPPAAGRPVLEGAPTPPAAQQRAA